MIDKNSAFKQLTDDILPAVQHCLQEGLMVVLIGATGTGKSFLAHKALPSAKVISCQDGVLKVTGEMDSDLIGDELYGLIDPDQCIRYRNQALALGHGVIFIAQRWQDVESHLAGLEMIRYKVFDLNRVWEIHGCPYYLPNPIPRSVLVN